MLPLLLLRRFSERRHESTPEDAAAEATDVIPDGRRPARPLAWLRRLASALWSRLRR